MIGKTISQYKILEELGRGGMGVVYKAEDTKLGRMVALKFLSSHLTEDETAKERFMREARAAAILRHDSICAIHDIGEEADGTMYIVMPHYDGETLKDRIGKGAIAPDLAVSIAQQIASGLSAAHAEGLTHRDIKPGNILLTHGDRVKVLDFGLAKLAGDVDLTLSSSTIGTMAYMSPEQVQNANVDARSDLWSLGVVLYEMLTGEKPFTGNYDAAIVYGIVNENLAMDHPHLPESLRPILTRLLDKDPNNRYASANELLAALGGERNVVSSPTEKTSPGAPSGGSARWVAIGAAVVALVALVFWISIRGDTQSDAPAQTIASSSGLPTVGVMYIENNTDNERLGSVLRGMLARNLGQVDSIQVISVQRLKDILRLEVGSDIESISASTATTVARQAGVQNMILGSVVQLGSQYVWETELIDVETGSIIDAVSVTAATEAELLPAVNQMTDGILMGSGKLGIGESGLYQVQNVSTSSFSAYELYEKGIDDYENWRFNQAEQSFLQAIEIDSTFVGPYIGAIYAASMFSFAPRANSEDAHAFIGKASRQLDHATEAERDEINLLKQQLEWPELSLIQDEIHRLAEKYPDEKRFQETAALWSIGDKKYEYFNRLFDLDPSYALGYNMLGYYQLFDGLLDEAVSTITRYRSLQPDVANTMDSAWDVMTGAERTDETLEMLDQALADHPDWTHILWRKAYTKILSGDTTGVAGHIENYAATSTSPLRTESFYKSHVALARGRWEEGRVLSATYLRESRRSRSDSELLFDLRNHAALLHAIERHDEAERLLEEAVEISNQVYSPAFNPIPVLAAYENSLGYAEVGDLDSVLKWSDILEQALASEGMDQRHFRYRELLKAYASVSGGDADQAIQNLASSKLSDFQFLSFANRLQARVYAMRGELDAARSRLRYTKHNTAATDFQIGAVPSFFIDHARIPYELAQLYDEYGDRQEAIRLYEAARQEYEAKGATFKYVDLTRDRLAELQAGR